MNQVKTLSVPFQKSNATVTPCTELMEMLRAIETSDAILPKINSFLQAPLASFDRSVNNATHFNLDERPLANNGSMMLRDANSNTISYINGNTSEALPRPNPEEMQLPSNSSDEVLSDINSNEIPPPYVNLKDVVYKDINSNINATPNESLNTLTSINVNPKALLVDSSKEITTIHVSVKDILLGDIDREASLLANPILVPYSSDRSSAVKTDYDSSSITLKKMFNFNAKHSLSEIDNEFEREKSSAKVTASLNHLTVGSTTTFGSEEPLNENCYEMHFATINSIADPLGDLDASVKTLATLDPAVMVSENVDPSDMVLENDNLIAVSETIDALKEMSFDGSNSATTPKPIHIEIPNDNYDTPLLRGLLNINNKSDMLPPKAFSIDAPILQGMLSQMQSVEFKINADVINSLNEGPLKSSLDNSNQPIQIFFLKTENSPETDEFENTRPMLFQFEERDNDWLNQPEPEIDQSSFLFNRFLFYFIEQEPNERFNDFLARLRQRAALCDFENEDRTIIDQILKYCRSEELRNKVLAAGDEVTLNFVITNANLLEIIDQLRECETIAEQNNNTLFPHLFDAADANVFLDILEVEAADDSVPV